MAAISTNNNESVWLKFVKNNYPSLFPLLSSSSSSSSPIPSFSVDFFFPHFKKGKEPSQILKKNYPFFIKEMGNGIPQWVRPLLWMILLDGYKDDQQIFNLENEEYQCGTLEQEARNQENNDNLRPIQADTPRIISREENREEFQAILLAYCQHTGSRYTGGVGFILKNLIDGLSPPSSPSPSSPPLFREILFLSFLKVMNSYKFEALLFTHPFPPALQESLPSLFSLFHPTLFSHFASLSLNSFGWEMRFLMSGFGYFEPPLLLNIWDRILFFGGSELFTALLAYLDSWKEELRAARAVEVSFPILNRAYVNDNEQFLKYMDLNSPIVSKVSNEKYPDFFPKNFELGSGTKSAKSKGKKQ